MTRKLFVCTALAVCFYGQANAAPAQNRDQESTQALQKAVDRDPSSAKAHEQLGAALLRDIVAGNVRPSADSDVAERAEHHLKRAIELAPFASGPLMELSTLEAVLAERSGDADQRAERYEKAQDLLKQALALEPGKAGMYFRLASLERDEFGPAIQQAKARFSGNRGPLPDSELRHSLQRQYGSLIEEAVQNGQKASEMAARSPQPLLLMSRLLRERALIRDTAEEYASDMHAADDWQRQFLIAGGHLDGTAPK
jgi:tetratricopeptide (TPR) repeat protein